MDNIPTDPGKSYAKVTWQVPVATDNSNETLEIRGLRPPQKLNVGKKYIEYKVTDPSGMSKSCSFFIHVKGTHCFHLKFLINVITVSVVIIIVVVIITIIRNIVATSL